MTRRGESRARGRCATPGHERIAAAGEAETEPGLWEHQCKDCMLRYEGAAVKWWPIRSRMLHHHVMDPEE